MDYYSKIAEGYDRLYAEEQLAKLKIIKEEIRRRGLVLDVGSGSGLSRHFFKNVVQLDPSVGLLKKSCGFRVCGVAEYLPFKDHVFDSVISVTSLHHTDVEKAVEEIRRVAKLRACLGFSILKRSKNFFKIVSLLKSKFRLKEKDSDKDLILIQTC
ncbi:MAG: class I SAM-dependent methyltransferase [Candidatus Nanoarchaeia archaeon]